jgi:putative addiction module component (TIGR02574 family)
MNETSPVRFGFSFHAVSRYNLPMSRSAAEILEDVRRLPPGEFDWLLGELFQADDGSSEADIEASWKAKAERRVAEVEAGTAVTSSWEEVEAPLRARLGKR